MNWLETINKRTDLTSESSIFFNFKNIILNEKFYFVKILNWPTKSDY